MLTSDAAFGFGQGVTGGARVNPQEKERQIVVNNKEDLKRTLTDLGNPGTTKTVISLADADYDFSRDSAFTIRAQNLTFQPLTTNPVKLKNLGLSLDLASIDNILIRNLDFQSDGQTGPSDGILFDGTNSTSGSTNRVRITRCTFHGYKDMAIEIRGHLSRVLATVDHCYFYDANPGVGAKFYNRGSLNVAGLVLKKGGRSTSNSFVTIAYNYFENVWRRSPRAATDGTHIHVFNNLLYRWGYQKNGVTDMSSWNAMETELNFHEEKNPGNAAAAVIQANRFLPWVDKQAKAIDPDAGTLVDIGQSTNNRPSTLSNRFDQPNGTSGNPSLLPRSDRIQIIDVNAWYAGLGLQAPAVTPAESVDWVTLARSAGTFVRSADSIPDRISAGTAVGVA